MSEEEIFKARLHEICEQEVYSKPYACKNFARYGSSKCQKEAKERYGTIIMGCRSFNGKLSQEEIQVKHEAIRAKARKYYYNRKERQREAEG